jgi:hypothetical protein
MSKNIDTINAAVAIIIKAAVIAVIFYGRVLLLYIHKPFVKNTYNLQLQLTTTTNECFSIYHWNTPNFGTAV